MNCTSQWQTQQSHPVSSLRSLKRHKMRTQIYERVSTCGCACCSSVPPPLRPSSALPCTYAYARLSSGASIVRAYCIACSLTRRTCGVVFCGCLSKRCSLVVHVDTAWNQSHTPARPPPLLQMSQTEIGAYSVCASTAPISHLGVWRTTVGSE